MFPREGLPQVTHLYNEKIVSLASGMGVKIATENFDSIDIMKDLELARQALNKHRQILCNEISEEVTLEEEVPYSEIPLLEWVDSDSQVEHYTLVPSIKKKKKRQTRLKNLVREFNIRRSKRTTPSIYRNIKG
jgi:hypothetical protein